MEKESAKKGQRGCYVSLMYDQFSEWSYRKGGASGENQTEARRRQSISQTSFIWVGIAVIYVVIPFCMQDLISCILVGIISFPHMISCQHWKTK